MSKKESNEDFRIVAMPSHDIVVTMCKRCIFCYIRVMRHKDGTKTHIPSCSNPKNVVPHMEITSGYSNDQIFYGCLLKKVKLVDITDDKKE